MPLKHLTTILVYSGHTPRLTAIVLATCSAPLNWAVGNVRIQVRIPAFEADRILGDEALELGVVVARPTVAPTASLAGEPRPPQCSLGDEG
jgi:hypothetical protein